MECGGKVHFCSNCKRLIDYALTTQHKERLYVEINPKVPAPDNRVVIPLCDNCKDTLSSELGIDGFIIEL